MSCRGETLRDATWLPSGGDEAIESPVAMWWKDELAV